ncbi:transcription activator protein (TrAP) [Begomovirus manihotisburkinafasoense]|uniref:Transcriptional activator protein n=1 Tax=Begomovirus manihotisburkinafasoense TaxID=2560285 RepID=H8WR17_9GEMI|nr:transcription activator protein (TrAP) [African cassava mosaic Burkina Faso virus]CCE94325.1 transcription activator protein (TrAP) [African cassava mosaic Burkina Faso virus]CCE94333.1 transcription activator protein (TrAP) [African cassava mosaic Burkina Faso virus]CCE94339.1 transcription activator protein (TrAP) [African cassava mosaic Burkina Faso virus]CCE94345.1 transcription activator protein (TrAP) [African cassava mosaic Burkina Faso virus]
MQSSSPSQNHSTPVPIKVSHRQFKTRAIRRRRVDLVCGCSYYLHINCSNHGFTHRGTHHCSSSNEWRVYLGNKQSPVFHNNRAPTTPIPDEPGHHNRPSSIQSQPEEGVGDSQMFSNLQDLDDLTASDWSFLKGL